MLTKEEKIGVINGRLKNVEFFKYDIELSIQEENALESPSASTLANYQARLIDAEARKNVLLSELEKLS